MKVVTTDYGNTKEILKYPGHYVGVAVMVGATGVAAGGDGKKIVPAGTIVGAGEVVSKANDGTAAGVLLWDVDVTHGDAAGTKVIHGFIDTAKLPEAPTQEARDALRLVAFL